MRAYEDDRPARLLRRAPGRPMQPRKPARRARRDVERPAVEIEPGGEELATLAARPMPEPAIALEIERHDAGERKALGRGGYEHPAIRPERLCPLPGELDDIDLGPDRVGHAVALVDQHDRDRPARDLARGRPGERDNRAVPKDFLIGRVVGARGAELVREHRRRPEELFVDPAVGEIAGEILRRLKHQEVGRADLRGVTDRVEDDLGLTEL